MTHICVGNLVQQWFRSPVRRQSIIWSNADLIINWTTRNKLQWNFNQHMKIFIQENAFENVVCATVAILTHWGRVKHICVVNLNTIGSDNGLSPGRRQAIIWTNARILLIWILGTNFSEILIDIHTFSFKKMHLNMSSGKCRPFCFGLNVLS